MDGGGDCARPGRGKVSARASAHRAIARRKNETWKGITNSGPETMAIGPPVTAAARGRGKWADASTWMSSVGGRQLAAATPTWPLRRSFECQPVTAPALRSGNEGPLNTRAAAPDLDVADRDVLNGARASGCRCAQLFTTPQSATEALTLGALVSLCSDRAPASHAHSAGGGVRRGVGGDWAESTALKGSRSNLFEQKRLLGTTSAAVGSSEAGWLGGWRG